jgi:hypothetical protein
MFFDKTETKHMIKKIKEFDENIHRGAFDSNKIKATTVRFSKENFKKTFKNFVVEQYNKHLENLPKP